MNIGPLGLGLLDPDVLKEAIEAIKESECLNLEALERLAEDTPSQIEAKQRRVLTLTEEEAERWAEFNREAKSKTSNGAKAVNSGA